MRALAGWALILEQLSAAYSSFNMKQMLNTKISELERARGQIDARITAEVARDREKERRRETRRKIVLGASVLRLAQENEGFRAWLLHTLLPRVAQRDRALIAETLSGISEPVHCVINRIAVGYQRASIDRYLANRGFNYFELARCHIESKAASESRSP